MISARVLVVEDHLLVRELYADLLQRLPQVGSYTLAGTVAEAIAAARREPPDFVLLDWALPDGSGFLVHDALRAELPDCRWALVTSHRQGGVRQEALDRGFRGWLPKQATKAELQTMIETVLAGGIAFAPALVDQPTGETDTFVAPQAVATDSDRILSQPQLTSQELLTLRGFAAGLSLPAIAEDMHSTVTCVQRDLARARVKLGISDPVELAEWLRRQGHSPGDGEAGPASGTSGPDDPWPTPPPAQINQ